MTDPEVLLVDDSLEDCELLMRALRDVGFAPEVVEVHDGQQAIDYLFGRNKRTAPMLTILDLKMPRVGGLEVLQRIRADAALKHLAVVILTSSDEERDRLEAQRLGVTFYFTKPMDFDGYLGLARRFQGMLSHLDGQ
ncbi:MAG TPA: response regulator [Elusimicrobiota bacterium]|nr:response regulator [Elusimicrobiota bacterium]